MPDREDDFVILSPGDAYLAEFLGECQHGDFAKIIHYLSEPARQELRLAVSRLVADHDPTKDKG